jgi:hypothetical protein
MITGIRNSRLAQWSIAAIALPLASLPLSAASGGMRVELCSADGTVRSLTIPVERDDGKDPCVKPCHACLTRKKNVKG